LIREYRKTDRRLSGATVFGALYAAAGDCPAAAGILSADRAPTPGHVLDPTRGL